MKKVLLLFAGIIMLISCKQQPPGNSAGETTEKIHLEGLDPDRLERIDNMLETAVVQGQIPGNNSSESL